DIPSRFVQRPRADRLTVSLSGRNLKTWSGYQGFEPEAMFLGGSRGGNASWEQTTLPQLTSWMLTFNLGFLGATMRILKTQFMRALAISGALVVGAAFDLDKVLQVDPPASIPAG